MAAEIWSAETARHYDADTADVATPEVLDPIVAVLTELSANGPVLEFAIGTGRVALPLAARGVAVSGIEQSPAMLAQLRAKPGGAELPVLVGDMAVDRVAGSYALVFLVFNTISNLLTQAEQVACFRNAAAHLRPGGAFVVELGVPDLRRLPPGESAVVFHHDDHHVGIDTYDVADQLMTSHHYHLGTERPVFHSHHRYAWPAELDLMAALAGLHLTDRWSTWHRHPFTSDSTTHISVYRKPE